MIDIPSLLKFTFAFATGWLLVKLGDALGRSATKKEEFMEETLTVLRRIDENLENLNKQMESINDELSFALTYKNINYHIRHINENLNKFINKNSKGEIKNENN